MAVEHAPANRRGLYGAAPAFGIALGILLAYLVMVVVSEVAQDAFVHGGWRIAFGVSVILIVVGTIVRKRISESPLFEAAVKKEQSEPRRLPLLAVLRRSPLAIVLGMGWATISASFGYIVQPYAVGYAAATHGYDQSVLLWSVIIGSAAKLVTVVIAGRMLDRIGRRPALIVIAILQIGSVVAFFPLLATGNVLLAILAFTLGLGTVGLVNGTIGSVLANLFPTDVAYTGVALTYNLSYSIGGAAPLIAASLLAGTGSITPSVVLLTALAVVALGVAIFRRNA